MNQKGNRNFLYALAIVYAIACWSNINSGFWGFESWNAGLSGALYAFRSAMPFLLPLIGVFFYFAQDSKLRNAANPAWWLNIYGVLALCSSLFSQNPYFAFYFGLAFMMAMYIPAMFFTKPLSKSEYPENIMIYTTWAILTVYVVSIYILFGNSIIMEQEILSKTKDSVLTMRSSGLARFYGVMAIILMVLVIHGLGKFRFLLIAPLGFCLMVVWRAQSRGAMFATMAGMMLLLFSTRLKVFWGLTISLIVGIAFLGYNFSYEKLNDYVFEQFRRGQNDSEFISMTGRTRAYKKGIEAIKQNPIMGRGNWADRMLIKEHVHNSYLQAAMIAGILGFVPYILSWIVAGILIVYILGRLEELSLKQQILFLQSAGVAVFFLVRSIPETTTASFSVDQVIMVPVFYFLYVTYWKLTEGDLCLKSPEKLKP